jgi:DNA mismatch repair protein MutL
MTQIRVLPEVLINKIAAGEVVERPASVVKELVENSLDAGASDIRIDVEEGGKRLIRVQDNGCGMHPDSALLALERHATSKIQELDDLERISTLGFRGEALPSIASVARVRLVSSDGSHPSGSEIQIEGGKIKDVRETGCPRGTTLEIRNLFYNTPVRKKFLKTHQTELSHITGLLTEIALAHPHVYFTLRHGSRTLLKTPPVSSLLERSLQVFGKEKKGQLMEMEEGREGIHLFGLISIPGYTRPSGTWMNFFVNRRPVRDRSLRHAVYEAYETLLMKGRHPEVYLFMDVDPGMVDVNVHPTKREVRFTNMKMIHDFLRDAVRKAAQGYGRTPAEVEGEEGVRHHPPQEERIREAVETYLRTHEGETSPRGPSRPRGAGFSGTIRPEQGEPHPVVQTLYLKEHLVPMGQIADSFIICQDRDGLILIDQHAAHERILYEKFKNYYSLSKIPVQHLLIPVNLELKGREEILLHEHLETLQSFGIEIEDFGHGTYTVKGVPMWVADTNIEEIIHSILQEIDQLGQSSEVQRRMEEIIHIFSCRAAIKAHQRLSLEEMESLLKDLSDTESPHTCEHGRPTMIRIGLQEIEKMFQRR